MRPFARDVLSTAIQKAVEQYFLLFGEPYHGTKQQTDAMLELGAWRTIDDAHRAAVLKELEDFREKAAHASCYYCRNKEVPVLKHGNWSHKVNTLGSLTWTLCDAIHIRSIDLDAFLDREQ